MKILIIVPSYKPAFRYGGPIRVVAALCESLIEAGHEVQVYTTNANGAEDLDMITGKVYNVDGVPVIYHKRITGDHSNLSFQLLRRLQKNYISFDIIHIHSWWNMVAVPSAWICMNKNIRPVITPHGSLSAYTLRQSKQLTKRILHNTIGRKLLENSTIHSTSEKENNEISELIISTSKFIIPNMVELPQGIKGVYKEDSFLKLVFVGRINPVKNLERILAILMTKVNIPFQLKIIGDGEEEYLKKLRMATRDTPQIKWLGTVDGDEKFRLLAESDLLILPSLTENSGIVVFEALSQGTAVLASQHVGAKEYILKHEMGWVVNDTDEEWSRIIPLIWSQKVIRNRIRANAPDIIKRDFNPKQHIQTYIAMYEQHLAHVN